MPTAKKHPKPSPSDVRWTRNLQRVRDVGYVVRDVGCVVLGLVGAGWQLFVLPQPNPYAFPIIGGLLGVPLLFRREDLPGGMNDDD